MKSLLFYLILLDLLLFASCQKGTVQDKPEINNLKSVTMDPLEMGTVKLGSIQKLPIDRWISAVGHVDVPPAYRATISVYYGGYVKSVNLLPGEQVRKGQVLFTMTNPKFIELQQEYMEANEALKFLKEDYVRNQLLMDENITSQKQFTKTESEYLSLKVKHQAMRENLKLINIKSKEVERGVIRGEIPVYAPIDGFVSIMNMNLGKYLEPSDVAMEIINTEHIHLELKVYEKDAVHISEGQRLKFKIPEAGEKMMQGVVHVAGKTIHGTERTVDIHGHLLNESLNLIHGMYVEADVEILSDSVMILPHQAIMRKGVNDFVAVYDDEKIRWISVKKGIQNTELIEIKNWNELLNQQVILNPKELE